MNWQKKGLIYRAPRDGSWRDNSALTPTPFVYSEEKIRIYTSFRDTKGVGRIGYVDLDKSDPTKIIEVSQKPVLDIGREGEFDCDGVILGEVLRVGSEVYLYYVGFKKSVEVKFYAFTGLAISKDGGTTFKRYDQAPILPGKDEAKYIRAIHSVVVENGIFKVWYATGNAWQEIDGVLKPCYDINCIESRDGISFADTGKKCIENNKSNLEYRIGRPRVYKQNDNYIMNFTYGTLDGKYLPGQATSKNGIDWQRNDSLLNIAPSSSGWDSIHLCYPVILSLEAKTYMFYNGNNMGEDGFGLAERMPVTI